MAKVFAEVATDLYDINLNDLISEQFSLDFYDNANHSFHGHVYQDVLRIGYYGDVASYANFGGTGIAFNASRDAVIAGTVTGFLQQLHLGGSDVNAWGVEDMSYSAVSMYNAATTFGTADDFAVFTAVLSGNDSFTLSSGNDRADGYAGHDRMYGNGGNDSLYGGAGNDTLVGGNGNDWMVGGSGNDTYYVDAAGDTTLETSTASTEIDLVVSGVTRSLGNNLEQLVLSGAGNISGYGNSLANTIWGNAGANTLSGGSGNDTLNGGRGNDTLVGGTGNDSMVGGLGNDTYYVDSAHDLTLEASGSGSGIDRVISGLTRTLGGNLEQLLLGGAADISGYGNALANTIWGNAGANTLAGGSGNDTLTGGRGDDTLVGGTGTDSMVGGLGNDTYYVNVAGDVTLETSSLSTEIDRVYASVTRTLGAHLEQLVLTGSGDIDGTGNAGANVIWGNAGDNELAGGSGNDTLIGGAGDDALVGGSGLDRFRFTASLNAATNVDHIVNFVSADDRIDLDNAVFRNIGPLGTLAGSAFHVGAAAADASDRVIYNDSTGRLYYDADGIGGTAAVLFATVAPHTAMALSDFQVI